MILALLVACQTRHPVGEAILEDVPAPDDYAGAARDATRELRLYTDGLTTALLLRAAWLDADFRRALEQERAHRLLLEPARREEALRASLAEGEASHVFILSADSQWREDLRFGFGEDEPWRLRLFVGDRACTPGTLEQVKKPTPLELDLYPHHTGWGSLWKVSFAADCGRPTAGAPLVLQVTGARGTGELGWRTEDGHGADSR